MWVPVMSKLGPDEPCERQTLACFQGGDNILFYSPRQGRTPIFYTGLSNFFMICWRFSDDTSVSSVSAGVM